MKVEMGKVLKRWELQNGLTLEAEDFSYNYYGEYWNIKVMIRGKIEVRSEYLDGLLAEEPYGEEALRRLGGEVEYRREITQVGVPEERLGETIGRLLGYFEENALPYIDHPSFPERFVQKRWREVAKEIRTEKMREELQGKGP